MKKYISNNPIKSDKDFIQAVILLYSPFFRAIIPVGDLVKEVPVVRMFHFLALNDEARMPAITIEPGRAVHFMDGVYDSLDIKDYIEDYIAKRQKCFLIDVQYTGQRGFYEFIYNYSDLVIQEAFQKILQLEDLKPSQSDWIYDDRAGRYEYYENIEDVFKDAGIPFFLPNSKK